MTAIATVRALITPLIPQASDIQVDRLLIEVARNFCDMSRAWQRTHTGLTITAGTHEVTLAPPTDGELVDVVKASLDGNPSMIKATQAQLDQLHPGWRENAATPGYVMLSDENLNEILVAPLPSATYTSVFRVRAAYKPVLGATTLDDILVSKHSDALVEGTLGKLFIIPGAPWNDNALGAYYTSLYEEKRNAAKQTSADGRMTGVARRVRYGGI
jgi:hypothetical protein